MIDPKELRIGNWVRVKSRVGKGDLAVSTVDWVSAYGERNIGLLGNGLKNESHRLEGIPLTPDILEKCGFANNGRYYIGDKGYNTFRNCKIELLQTKKGDPFILAIYETKILYLHQLQNVFYCLCGEELSVNLP